MEEKNIAIYVMVRKDELLPEDAGSYDGALARQRDACLRFLTETTGGDAAPSNVQVYTRRGDLLLDIERQKISRLFVMSLDRLGSSKEEIDGILFELGMAGVELSVMPG